MNNNQARELLKKYREGTLTDQERALLETWYLKLGSSQESQVDTNTMQDNLDAVWQSLPFNQPPVTRKLMPNQFVTQWLAVAAAILIFLALGAYLLRNQFNTLQADKVVQSETILPGDNRALLTLADGTRIVLDDAKSGELARRGNASIVKSNDGTILFNFSRAGSGVGELTQSFNEVSTPRAGQYQVKLPDGTNVWLNAVSTIRFPTVFPSHERVVEVTGEVYFEVAKKNNGKGRIPFKVVVANQTIEVLGTEFNVKSYHDEDLIKTTLLEGSVKINVTGPNKPSIILQPGQQAQVVNKTIGKHPNSDNLIRVEQVNAEGAISWKNGYFRFDDTSLPELMRQISRWYDVEVVYEGAAIKEHEFVGQIERKANLSELLKILELGDVKFRLEGKKIIVTE